MVLESYMALTRASAHEIIDHFAVKADLVALPRRSNAIRVPRSCGMRNYAKRCRKQIDATRYVVGVAIVVDLYFVPFVYRLLRVIRG